MTECALYVVATPIGNMGDMVPRAIEVLQSVEVIAAEDTRHSARLMETCQIKTPMVPYHDHSNERQVESLLGYLEQGQSVALISDAGTPLVSDPGYRLVRSARDRGHRVVPIPGPCALIAALSASGLPSDRFSFEGFLPAKSGQRSTALTALQREQRTMIFYEAPHRVLDSLKSMSCVFGDNREAVMAREITKTFETIRGGSLAELVDFVANDSNQQKGEIVLMVRGDAAQQTSELDPEAQRVMEILCRDLRVKQASELAAEITGVKKKLLYQWAVSRD